MSGNTEVVSLTSSTYRCPSQEGITKARPSVYRQSRYTDLKINSSTKPKNLEGFVTLCSYMGQCTCAGIYVPKPTEMFIFENVVRWVSPSSLRPSQCCWYSAAQFATFTSNVARSQLFYFYHVIVPLRQHMVVRKIRKINC